MFFPVSSWFPAFIFTVVLEVPVVWLVLHDREPSTLRLGLLVVFANLATHPAVWFVLTQVFTVGTTDYTLASEGWAAGAEALFYLVAVPAAGPARAIGAALAANAASYLAGLLIGGLSPGLF